jgi:hypothetical protein
LPVKIRSGVPIRGVEMKGDAAMRNLKASEFLLNLLAETVSLQGAVAEIRESLELQQGAEDTLDALEHVRFSLVQAFDALKIAENEAADMETREEPKLTDHELLIAASAPRHPGRGGRDEADEDETPTLELSVPPATRADPEAIERHKAEIVECQRRNRDESELRLRG